MTNFGFHYSAMKFKKETLSIYCSNSRVNFPSQAVLPETLLTYVSEANQESTLSKEYSEVQLMLSNEIVWSNEYCVI